MRLKWLLAAALVMLLVGCAKDGKKKPTDKELVTQQWRDARANVLFGLGRDQYQHGNFEQSRKTVDDAIKLSPNNSHLRVLSAKLAIEQGQLELAEKELIKARDADPKNAEADYLSGVIYQRWQRPETAYHCYSVAAEKAPAELAYLMARSEMLVAMNRQNEALKLLKDKVVYFEHSPVIRDAVGQLLVQQGRYKEGADMLREATILGPDDITIREHFALALYFNVDYREAIEQIKRLQQKDEYEKRADLWVIKGECHMHMDDVRAARSCFDTATQRDEGLVSAWLSLGRANMELNDLRRADIASRKAMHLEPQNPDCYLLQGYIRLRQGKPDEALAVFRKASALDKDDTVSLCMVGYTLEKMGQNAQAVKYYAQALRLKPGDELAKNLMAGVDVSK
jgi:tetratricopeptide (TPR) repeat protein